MGIRWMVILVARGVAWRRTLNRYDRCIKGTITYRWNVGKYWLPDENEINDKEMRNDVFKHCKKEKERLKRWFCTHTKWVIQASHRSCGIRQSATIYWHSMFYITQAEYSVLYSTLNAWKMWQTRAYNTSSMVCLDDLFFVCTSAIDEYNIFIVKYNGWKWCKY